MKEVQKLQEKLNSLHKKEELSSEKVELAALQDIESILDKAISRKNKETSSIINAAGSLLDLTADLNKAFLLARKSAAQAKELGADDLVKLFLNRADEAKSLSNELGTVATKIEKAARSV